MRAHFIVRIIIYSLVCWLVDKQENNGMPNTQHISSYLGIGFWVVVVVTIAVTAVHVAGFQDLRKIFATFVQAYILIKTKKSKKTTDKYRSQHLTRQTVTCIMQQNLPPKN